VRLIKNAQVACVAGIFVVACLGQSSSLTVGSSDGLTPPAIQPGAPSGSYALTGFESVNLFNGKLNVAIPLLKIGGQSGRTEAGYTMTWPVDKFWDVSTSEDCNPDGNGGIACYTSTLITDSGWNSGAAPGLSPGTMWARSSGDQLGFCFFPTTNSTYYYSNNTTTRLTFTHPDGTETEFVDQAHVVSRNCTTSLAAPAIGPARTAARRSLPPMAPARVLHQVKTSSISGRAL
jgi:hypothetical protein